MRIYTFNHGGWYYTYLNGSEACRRGFFASLAAAVYIKLKGLRYEQKKQL